MKKMMTPFMLVTVLIIGFAGQTYAIEFCKNILDKTTLAVENLDAEYQRVFHQEKGTKQTAQITDLLNRAFFPMLDQLSRHVTKLDEHHIQFELQTVRKRQPLKAGTFETYNYRRYPQINDSHLRDLFYHNTGATHIYRLFERENVRQFNSMFYIDYKKERVQRLGVTHKQFGSLITPIGEYGPGFAKNMLRTTEILIQIADDTLTDLSIETFEKNPILLTSEAGRVESAKEEYTLPKLGAKNGVLEGILTFHQMVNIMLAEKVPGLETGEEALKAFIFSSTSRLGLTSSLTARIPMALVGPMSISGLGFAGGLQLNERGLLEPTEQMKTTLADVMDLQVKSGRRRSRCPVAGFLAGKNQGEMKSPHENLDKAGLQLLAEAYWKVFRVVSKENPEGSTPSYEHAAERLFTMNTPRPPEKPKAKNPFEKMRQGLEELIFGREP